MVELPDQDWLAFGFWLTAPDDTANGLHRIGVVYDGMDTYGYQAATGASDPLDGTATYEGSAAGYYVNGTESGVFTASASLKADFVEHMLEGRIDNFKDSRGAFIGSDTRADPNDPMHGGESDWVVRLRKTDITGTGGFEMPMPARRRVPRTACCGTASGTPSSTAAAIGSRCLRTTALRRRRLRRHSPPRAVSPETFGLSATR